MLGFGAAGLLQSTHWSRLCHHQQPLPPGPSCALTKQGHRFLTSVAVSDTRAEDDPKRTQRLIRKFIASSTKHVALSTLNHLISPSTSHPHLSSLAFPMYSIMSEEASWFDWNSKLVADVIAFLYNQEGYVQAEGLIFQTVSKIGESRERELCNFYCNLVESHSKYKSKKGVVDACTKLKRQLSNSSSVYSKRRGYESMISGLCAIESPNEAEILMQEMRDLDMKPSMFEFRCLIYGYGRLGLFQDMKRVLTEMASEGLELDTVCSNMVLSSYGAHNELPEMVLWLRQMKVAGVPFSVRTFNSVLNYCPSVISMLEDLKSVPLSLDELMENLYGDEADLVREVLGSNSVLNAAMEWKSTELKLDLHGMHLSTAYLITLQWFQELRLKFLAGDQVIPAEVTLVCGAGKHSAVRGESPVKCLIKTMLLRMNCPMKIDRKNIGCFVAKGKVLKDWLCSMLIPLQ